VAAVLRGSDAVKSSEAVLFTAHYDAYGKDATGRIFPGAADNALGTAEMMATAAAFAAQKARAKRSLLFLAVTGEEHGLLGAEAWASAPTWPLAKVAADLNLDGIGSETYGPVTSAVGFGADLSDLGPVFTKAVGELGIAVAADPFPEEGVFQRSDHFAFVKKGVPALMLLGSPTGSAWIARAKQWMEITGDYHQPGDTVKADWHWGGPVAVAKVMTLVGSRIAAQDAMPAWNKGSQWDKPRAAAAH
jgi:Zn-dependent M28 family amino/carboxypeptidase